MDEQEKSHIIFIANLMPTINRDQVKELFKRFGKIVSVDLIRKRPENVFAFIEFDDMRDAVDALEQFNKSNLKSKKLRIEYRNGGLAERRNATEYEEGLEGRGKNTLTSAPTAVVPTPVKEPLVKEQPVLLAQKSENAPPAIKEPKQMVVEKLQTPKRQTPLRRQPSPRQNSRSRSRDREVSSLRQELSRMSQRIQEIYDRLDTIGRKR